MRPGADRRGDEACEMTVYQFADHRDGKNQPSNSISGQRRRGALAVSQKPESDRLLDALYRLQAIFEKVPEDQRDGRWRWPRPPTRKI